MKLLHFADLHLDAPFAWAPPDAARRRRRNRREVLTRIIELAERERVDGILSAGDLFEHDRFAPDTVEFLRATFARTAVPVYLAPGNHDWYSAASPYASVDWSPNVTVFTESRLEPVTLAEGLTLWGAAHRAPAGTDGFFAGFHPDRGGIHLALAHASERGALPWQDEGTQPHAPFAEDELAAAGLAHAFLGHYHVAREADRYTYPGNPDPLAFGESPGRGAVIATIAGDGSVSRAWHDVAVTSVHDRRLDLTGCEHSDDVRAAVESALHGLVGWVRLTLVGEVPPTVEVDPRELAALGGHLDALVVRGDALTAAYDLDAIASEATIRGQFVRDAAAAVTDPEVRRRVVLTGLRALDGRSDLEVA